MIIGYVPLDEIGDPHRPIVGRNYHARRKPITIYKTLSRAKTYSPVGQAKAVYIEEDA